MSDDSDWNWSDSDFIQRDEKMQQLLAEHQDDVFDDSDEEDDDDDALEKKAALEQKNYDSEDEEASDEEDEFESNKVSSDAEASDEEDEDEDEDYELEEVTVEDEVSKIKFEGKIPTITELWSQKILQDVGWQWPNGQYRVIDLNTNKVIASNIEDPLQFMLEHGIPNVERLKAKDQQSQKERSDAALRLAKIEQACRFRHVEETNLTSASQDLGTEGDFSNEILSDESIATILNKDVYKNGLSSDGSWHLSPNHTLATLQQVRIFIRNNAVFAKSRLNKKTLLSLRLWAALSPDPLPVFDLKKCREQHPAPTSTATKNPPVAGHTNTRAPSRRVSGASNEGSSSNEDNTNYYPEPDRAPVSGRVSEVGTATENARSMENITGNNNSNNTSSTHPHHGSTTAGRLSDNSRSYMNNARSVAAKQQDSDDSSSDYEDSSDEESDESSSNKTTCVAKGRAEKNTVNNNSRPTNTCHLVASAKAQQSVKTKSVPNKEDEESEPEEESQDVEITWEWVLEGGPKRASKWHYKINTSAYKDRYIWLCRCDDCLSNSPTAAKFTTFDMNAFVPLREPHTTDKAHKNKIYLDEHGFVHYDQPFPSSSLVMRNKSHTRNHLVKANPSITCEDHMPGCVQLTNKKKSHTFWAGYQPVKDVTTSKAKQPARKQDSQSKYSIQSQGRAAQNMQQASTQNNSSRSSHARSLKAPHPLQLQAQKQQSQTSRGGGAVQNLRQESTSRGKCDGNNGNRKRKADDDQGDGSELFRATFDYEKMTTKSINDSTEELKRKAKRLQQIAAVSHVNGIIAEALVVQEKILDFNKENLRYTDDNTGGDNENPLPYLTYYCEMEWDEIDQAEEQAKSELQRLKAKLSAIQQHQKALEEYHRAERKSQHRLARRIS